MTTRKIKPALLYAGTAPGRWLQMTADVFQESLATACARQWQRARVVAIQHSGTIAARRRFR